MDDQALCRNAFRLAAAAFLLTAANFLTGLNAPAIARALAGLIG